MVRRVYLAQPNYRFGANAFLPYSVGRIWAYAQTIPEIRTNYGLGAMIWQREDISAWMRGASGWTPDVLALSCYLWNWEYNKRLARAVRERWPNCLIVMGGPQVPNETSEAFWSQTSADIVVHGEGERAFAAILQERLGAEEYTRIPGVSTRKHRGSFARTEALDALPSPYLSGVFDGLMQLPVQWQALQETNRGCCYSCRFCAWGISALSKMQKFPVDTALREIEWFAEHKIGLIYNADSNWGIFEQDYAISKALCESKARTGYPQKFRAAYAKKITPRVFAISKMLADAGLSKGATISMQSLNPNTLKAVERQNIAVADLPATFARYNEAGIPTYSELILGLPLETYDSFADGIDRLLEAGQHYGLAIYPAMILPNSEMAEPEYRYHYGMQTRTVRMLLLHGTHEPGDIAEQYEIVIATSTMPHGDWRKAYLLATIIQAYHCTGLTDQIARAVHGMGARDGLGIRYREFYEWLITWGWGHPSSVIGQECNTFREMLDEVLEGGEWNTVLPECGNTVWPVEEAATIRAVLNRKRFYDDLARFCAPLDIPIEIIAAQEDSVIGPEDFGGDIETWARETIWYGRKGRKKNAA